MSDDDWVIVSVPAIEYTVIGAVEPVDFFSDEVGEVRIEVANDATAWNLPSGGAVILKVFRPKSQVTDDTPPLLAAMVMPYLLAVHLSEVLTSAAIMAKLAP